eukprot:gene34735-46642_t
MGDGVRDNLSLEIQVAKLRHKISSVSAISRSVSPSRSAAYSNNILVGINSIRKLPNCAPKQVTELSVLQINNTFHEKVIQPNYLSEKNAFVNSIITHKNSEKANTTGKSLEKSNKKPSIAIIGNDLNYFNNLFPKRSNDKNYRSGFGFDDSISEPALSNPLALNVVSNVKQNESRGNTIKSASSRIDKNASADKMLTVRQINDSPPITVRLPVLPIELDRMDDSSEVFNVQDEDEVDTSAIRRTLVALEIDGGIDINSYDDHTKEEFYQRSKMIASNHSVQILATTASVPEGSLDVNALPNAGNIDKLQGTTKEDTSSPKQQPLDSQRKSTNKNMLTISSEADPKEEAAATAVPDPQRPVRGAKGILGMRRTGRVSGSSSTLVGAVSSPSAGKVFQ